MLSLFEKQKFSCAVLVADFNVIHFLLWCPSSYIRDPSFTRTYLKVILYQIKIITVTFNLWVRRQTRRTFTYLLVILRVQFLHKETQKAFFWTWYNLQNKRNSHHNSSCNILSTHEMLYLQVGFVRDVDPVTTGSCWLSEFFLPPSCYCISSKASPFVSGIKTAMKIVPAMHITANSQNVAGNHNTSSKFWNDLVIANASIQLNAALKPEAMPFTLLGNNSPSIIHGIGPNSMEKTMMNVATIARGSQLMELTSCPRDFRWKHRPRVVRQTAMTVEESRRRIRRPVLSTSSFEE